MNKTSVACAMLTVMGLVGLCAPGSANAGVLDWLHKSKDDGCDEVVCEPECGPACAPDTCTTGVCETGNCPSGTCGNRCAKGPKWHSDEWYAMRAHLPPGERPHYKHGKLTPVEPRPDLPPQPYWHIYHSVKNWPHPYDCRDRESIGATYAAIHQTGWAEVTTLHDHHFDLDTQMLNAAGIAKVKYVLTGVPPEHKMLYVANGIPQLDSTRIANVRASLVNLTGAADSIGVMSRNSQPMPRPATEVESVNRARLEQMLPPVITYDAAETE